MLKIGQQVGDFEAQTSSGETIRLEALRGAPFVAYFYPKSFTPGCTIETRNFAQLYPEFRERGVEVVGISADVLETQCKFAEEMGAEFPIVDDSSGGVAGAFGLSKRLFLGYKRVTFVVDERGEVEQVFKVGLGWANHPREVLDYLDARAPAASK